MNLKMNNNSRQRLSLNLLLVLMLFTLFMGCGESSSNNPDSSSQNIASQDSGLGSQSVSEDQGAAHAEFPRQIKKQLTDTINVNADIIYPENCALGSAVSASVSDDLLWNHKEELIELLFHDKNIAEDSSLDESVVKTERIVSDNEEDIMMLYSHNYFTYTSKLTPYIQNTLLYDERFEGYNGYMYQKVRDLPFLSQNEAWMAVKNILQQMNIAVSDNYICFSMNHEIMSREEEHLAQVMGEEEGEVRKESWTPEDDCYYFMSRQLWEEYPVVGETGEGIDENNITVIYSARGVEAITVSGYYPLQKEADVSVQSPENVLESLQKYLDNIISNNRYEVQKITLCQKVLLRGMDIVSTESVPAWECLVKIISDENSTGYTKKIYFDAKTLKPIAS